MRTIFYNSFSKLKTIAIILELQKWPSRAIEHYRIIYRVWSQGPNTLRASNHSSIILTLIYQRVFKMCISTCISKSTFVRISTFISLSTFAIISTRIQKMYCNVNMYTHINVWMCISTFVCVLSSCICAYRCVFENVYQHVGVSCEKELDVDLGSRSTLFLSYRSLV